MFRVLINVSSSSSNPNGRGRIFKESTVLVLVYTWESEDWKDNFGFGI